MAVEGTAKLGYQIIEIPLLDPASVDAAMTKRILAEFGLKVGHG
jgi:D-psicose/D-tagatose/L-ribulose 3-epimerase